MIVIVMCECILKNVREVPIGSNFYIIGMLYYLIPHENSAFKKLKKFEDNLLTYGNNFHTLTLQ